MPFYTILEIKVYQFSKKRKIMRNKGLDNNFASTKYLKRKKIMHKEINITLNLKGIRTIVLKENCPPVRVRV